MAKTYDIEGINLEITDSMQSYFDIRNQYLELSQNVSERFISDYSTFFIDMNDLHNRGLETGMTIIYEYIDDVMGTLAKNGVLDIDEDDFFSDYYSPYFDYYDAFEKIDDTYNEATMSHEEYVQYRQYKKDNRAKFIGGGFGVSGAIKGAATAGALNIVTGSALSLLNFGLNAIDKAMTNHELKKLFLDPETRVSLGEALEQSVFNIHYAIIDALNDRSDSACYTITDEAEEKSAKMIKNLGKLSIEDVVFVNGVKSVFNLNPLEPNLYVLLAEKLKDPRELIELTGDVGTSSVVFECEVKKAYEKLIDKEGDTKKSWILTEKHVILSCLLATYQTKTTTLCPQHCFLMNQISKKSIIIRIIRSHL